MIKILVIEDEVSILDNIADYLEMNDYQVYKATNGSDGLILAKNINPDIILCDIMMPEIDGLTVLKELKRDTNTSDIPFVFLTARTEENDFREGMNLGADDYIKKPFRNSDLLASIQARLSKSRQIIEKSEKKLNDIRYSLTVSLPHELYTPLNGILGYTQLLKNDIYSFHKDELDEILNNLANSAQRLNKIINNYVYYLSLLEIINSGVSFTDEVTTNPSEIIEGQAKILSETYSNSKDISLQISNERISIATIHFEKLIYELIDNAFKFSFPDSKITVKAFNYQGKYKLSIHNYGSGLAQEQIKKIGAYLQFNRQKLEQQGLGLGLAIIKKIAEIYNLDADIFSIINDSFEVTILFPLAK